MKPVWLVLPDPFSSRLFFDTGIVADLRERLGERLELFLLDTSEHENAWSERAGDARVTRASDLNAPHRGMPEKAFRRVDQWLDRRVGFYPLSLRQSLREGFNQGRMQPGHNNWFLDPELAGPLPLKVPVDPALKRWHYGRLRYISPLLLRRLRSEQPAVVLANIQMHAVVPFIVGARRLGLPLVGHVASWDHTVGKGIVPPHLQRYIVQNEVMREDLVRYHGIDSDRIVVTGWPQTDVFYRKRPREEYEQVVRALGLDPSRPVVLVMGNTPTNAPYEKRFVERLVAWWEESGAVSVFSLLFRPHPRDREWREEYEQVVRALGLDPSRPVVLVMGNTPTNAPYEKRFVERLVAWWEESGAVSVFSLLFRPHPRDREWRERFAPALFREGAAVQEPSFTDLDTLAALLQHGECVVTNAGTILLDALVNDRPTVCVLYDEGAPAGESWAVKNVSGEHYRQLMASDAFYRAGRFEDVVAGIEHGLAQPDELAQERARAAREVVGDVDGRAAARVVDAVVSAVD